MLSGRVWPAIATRVASAFAGLRGCHPVAPSKHLAGLIDGAPNASFSELLDAVGFVPAGKRARSTVGTCVASCIQPSRRIAPTIIPEGIGPEAHLSVALSLQHPFSRPHSFPPHIARCFTDQPADPVALVDSRVGVSAAVDALAELLASELFCLGGC